jgi:hypothetical protein
MPTKEELEIAEIFTHRLCVDQKVKEVRMNAGSNSSVFIESTSPRPPNCPTQNFLPVEFSPPILLDGGRDRRIEPIWDCLAVAQ